MDLIVTFVAAAIGGVALWLIQRNIGRDRHWKRRLASAPAAAVGESKPGAVVRLRGRVRLAPQGQPLRSPLGNRSCLAYRYKESYMRSGYSAEEVTFFSTLEIGKLVFEDESGSAEIVARDVDMRLVVDQIVQGKGPDTDAYVDRWLDSGKKVPKKKEFYRREAILADGAEVLVLAKVGSRLAAQGDLPPGFRDAPRERILEAPGEHALYVCADPAWL